MAIATPESFRTPRFQIPKALLEAAAVRAASRATEKLMPLRSYQSIGILNVTVNSPRHSTALLG
jgi:hypothetical protein